MIKETSMHRLIKILEAYSRFSAPKKKSEGGLVFLRISHLGCNRDRSFRWLYGSVLRPYQYISTFPIPTSTFNLCSFPHAQPYEFLHPSIKLVLRPIFRFRIILKEISIPIQAIIIRINTIDNSRLRIPLQKLSACLSEGRKSADEIKHAPVGSRSSAISSTKESEPEL